MLESVVIQMHIRKKPNVCKKNRFAPLAIHQPNYSMLNRWIENGLMDTCSEHGLGMIAFCPLFQGLLTNKYLKGIPDGSRATIQILHFVKVK